VLKEMLPSPRRIAVIASPEHVGPPKESAASKTAADRLGLNGWPTSSTGCSRARGRPSCRPSCRGRSRTVEMVVTLKTARALGVAIPQPVLLRVTRVIE
jgi:hypothetical protein